MLSVHGRRPAAVIVEPVARVLLKTGLSPNVVTVLGAAVTSIIAIVLIPSGYLVWAAILTGLFSAFDMVDGTMARLRGGGTKFGATLDATCDRITDGVFFAAITWWLIYSYDASAPLVVASLVVLVASQVISYVKARGEASGFSMIGGLVERPERLLIGAFGIGLQGLGVPFAIDVAIWILAAGSVYTVIQRLLIASRSPHASDPTAPPAGSREAREQEASQSTESR
ncbi:phosphatidylinositol phosphate synthase [Corynebacterium alimapuense]|uniref:Phosphatidylinositol phosphate synthase n=1 Tax=Corynebacterium alimapuense TaxID=1576874 RepID=A0A3M8K9S6_9CORY|nr:CDP-alcohol phosphatidyltransferase family protein [Corynebacterium alimapuense]RNE49274.1 phosphatidylglycerophosphate synthase [Corynebacterium alimapuense]